ncbi:GNAT family N-acetyltransferase [Imperialibacter roseus]|uniref:GNAT family N-acetyltransferase n=1 Tax=Imperialibacter roseus TaxID=1324217 RepID=A0ABZ0IP98_9BACT|nr:GNAT family N-acetyltransferase [Imperialibacter roseus]WOK06294.1 GNAT family N-acetyltransferase [Imperialibacter roseus]
MVSTELFFRINTALWTDIANHLNDCKENFSPCLDTKVNINEYANKIRSNAVTFEAWAQDRLVGLVAAYFNDDTHGIGYITNVSTVKAYFGMGVAGNLLSNCIEYGKVRNYHKIGLEVNCQAKPAIHLYKKHNFEANHRDGEVLKMSLKLNRSIMKDRDYNKELKDTSDHKYAYDFDFDVMHGFMLKSFTNFFRPGSLLELGSFKGDFTKRLIPHFDDITCVEASDEAIQLAKKELGGKVKFVNSLFESLELNEKYDNVILTHVLEHIDDPVLVLKKINDQWLSDNGRLFLVCPNANAPSRQIAVKMGLISHNSAITPAESEHGHRITYTLDTLERDAKAAGLNVVFRTGIFFKALANFQWDRLLQTDIISNEYLEGCYQLGHQYPDLCSSIFLLCEKGK